MPPWPASHPSPCPAARAPGREDPFRHERVWGQRRCQGRCQGRCRSLQGRVPGGAGRAEEVAGEAGRCIGCAGLGAASRPRPGPVQASRSGATLSPRLSGLRPPSPRLWPGNGPQGAPPADSWGPGCEPQAASLRGPSPHPHGLVSEEEEDAGPWVPGERDTGRGAHRGAEFGFPTIVWPRQVGVQERAVGRRPRSRGNGSPSCLGRVRGRQLEDKFSRSRPSPSPLPGTWGPSASFPTTSRGVFLPSCRWFLTSQPFSGACAPARWSCFRARSHWMRAGEGAPGWVWDQPRGSGAGSAPSGPRGGGGL